MLYKIRQSKYTRVLAVYLVFNLLMPVSFFNASANTNGTGSADFSPAAFGNMVDAFTGDFNYSIPLMEVPGPGGSYPIILGYSSSAVNSEADAGWVGLGWNLNIGSVTREMKGLPDDFKGDIVTKSYNMKKLTHTGFNVGGAGLSEFFGFDLAMPVNVQLYQNSYTGFGLSFGTSLASNIIGNTSSEKQIPSIVGSLNFNYDTQNGFGFDINYNLKSKFFRITKDQAVNMRQGSLNSTFSGSFHAIGGFSQSLNKTNYIPGEGLPLTYSGSTFAATLGIDDIGTHDNLNVSLSKFSQELAQHTEELPAAGYLYLNAALSNPNTLMDYNRENDIPVNKESKTLGVPVLQADEYIASGNDFNISFRPYRNDIGILQPEKREAAFSMPSDEIDVAPPAPTDWKIAANAVNTVSSIYTGPWQNSAALNLALLNYKPDQTGPSGSSAEVVIEEPVYFKSSNDLTKSNSDFITNVGGYGPANFALGYADKEPVVQNILTCNSVSQPNLQQYSSRRAARETYIQQEKIGEITSNELYTGSKFYVWSDTTADGNVVGKPAGGSGNALYSYPGGRDHHIGRFKINSSSGVEYEYALPVYNNTYVEAFYATDQETGSEYGNTSATVSSNLTEASIDNSAGADNLFYRTSLSPFTTAHLLTGIKGHDYVDLKNDGITDDDLGYFMKLNYTKYYSDFRWRTPYKDSYYKKGTYTNVTDDRAAYFYGTKEVYYLNSIESKTHVAVFVLKDRKDGCQPTDGGGNHEWNSDAASSGNAKLRYLDKIILYNKEDLTQPLQTVDLDYDYSLYTNAPSSYGGNGKLTLKSIKITYLNNDKGNLTPYTFTYNSTGSYVTMGNDRWGVSSSTSSISGVDWDNLENTFQMQGDYNKDGQVDADDQTDLNTNVAKGLLSGITLPSGGAIAVHYESDDYGYVQDQRAQALVRIVGTSETSTPTYDPDAEIKKGDLRIYFQLPVPIIDDGVSGTSGEDVQVAEYIQGLKQVYFKTFQQLRHRQSDNELVYDYVNGYAEIETDNGYGIDATATATVGSDTYYTRGYITLKAAHYGAADLNVHPFRKAGWQYLRVQRNDLETAPVTTSGSSFSIVGEFIDLITSIPEIVGYYNGCAIKNYCPNLQLSSFDSHDAKPSFLRLNHPSYKKTGGGHRVSKITWTDNFGDHAHTLGQTYRYVTADGKSSGVATSEPINGKEDNTLSAPRYYVADPNTIYKSDLNFLEGPCNESYFPAPGVGYSRVVVSNIPYAENIPGTSTADDVTDNNNGTDVYEFYTCKDFPVITQSTTLATVGYNGIDLNIPIGYDNYMYNGYSQGFYCEVNDMHGKAKSQATYKTGVDLTTAAPVHKREYKYFTDAQGKLQNNVPTLKFDATPENMVMGEEYEFFADMLEHTTSTIVTGDQYNLDVSVFPFPTWFPTQVSENNIFRAIATNKIVHKKGIIKQIIENNEGEITVTDNLYFDQETGDALLTSVNNSFDAPVYNYHYAGHWYYDAMQAMYQNNGAALYNITSSGTVSLSLANASLHNGDRLMVITNGGGGTTPTGTVLYIHNLDNDSFDLEDIDGNAPDLDNAQLKIIRSGFRNLQSVACGSLESLQDPVTDNTNVFLMYNRQVTGQVNDDNYTFNDVKTCNNSGTETVRDIDMDLTTGESGFIQFSTGVQCTFVLAFDVRSDAQLKDFMFLSFEPNSDHILLKDMVTGLVYDISIDGTSKTAYNNCYKSCFTVLNAASAEYDNGDWNYDYTDAGDPKIFVSSSEVDLDGNGNDYHYGKSGIYRVKKNYAYQVARKQQGSASTFHTKINEDGEYAEFTPFDWMVAGNAKWTFAQELTRVSPYGITLETSDRSGIMASSITGFNNKTITAQSANASYFETAFDGFEDYDYVSSAYDYDQHGHFSLKQVNLSEIPSDLALSDTRAHTGKVSAVLEDDKKVVHEFSAASTLPAGEYYDAVTNKRYLASGWFYAPGHYLTPVIKVKDLTSNSYIIPSVTYDNYPAIEGWKKMEIGFEVTNAAHNYRIEWYLYNTQTSLIVDGYLDDIRVHPFKAAMVSMVYDPLTLWKTAELDNQNFATFYNYDEEGNVVQVKKETVNGVVTIGTTRNNLKRE